MYNEIPINKSIWFNFFENIKMCSLSNTDCPFTHNFHLPPIYDQSVRKIFSIQK